MWSRILKRKWDKPGCLSVREKTYQETVAPLSNPGRGWYRIYTYDAGRPFQPPEAGIFGEERLALVRISLERYRDERLPEDCLDNIRKILHCFDTAKVDVILRVAYDFEGKGEQKEPDLFSQVQLHLRQLAALVREDENRILVFQGLLVGSWGEMHNSKFLAEKRLRALEDAFRSEGNERVWLAVRRPVFLRMLAAEGAGVGKRTIFDDAIGGSETDLGTFGTRGRPKAGWKEPWARKDELAFIQRVCAAAPFGGEVLPPLDGGPGLSPAETMAVLRDIHLSYLNQEHDRRILDKWRKQPVKRNDIWNGASLYDYIGAHMGYRFCVRRAAVTLENGGSGRRSLSMEIENTGFGDLLQEAQAELVWVDQAGKQYRQPLDWDARSWHSGTKVACTAQIQPQAETLCLELSRKWDGSRILFANEAPVLSLGGENVGTVSIY